MDVHHEIIAARVKHGMLELLDVPPSVELAEGQEVCIRLHDAPPPRNRQAFLRAAGGWSDMSEEEAQEFLDYIYARRSDPLNSRPAPSLPE